MFTCMFSLFFFVLSVADDAVVVQDDAYGSFHGHTPGFNEEFSVDVLVERGLVSVVSTLNGERVQDGDMVYTWDDWIVTQWPDRDDIGTGEHHVEVTWKDWSVKKTFQVNKGGVEECTELVKCGEKRRFHEKVFLVDCLVKAAQPALWWNVTLEGRNFEPLTRCHLRAGVALARQLSSLESVFHPIDALFGGDDGSIHLATLLSYVIEKRFKMGQSDDRDLTMRMTPIFWKDEEVFHWFQQWKHESSIDEDQFRVLVMCNLWRQCPYRSPPSQCLVAVFGPQGFNNDPIFAPIMAASNMNCTVMSVLPRRYMFLSSLVKEVSFPWRLEIHVQLVARYWTDVQNAFHPMVTFPADSYSVLTLSWLKGPEHYPPCSLSKLCPWVVEHSPLSIVASDDDGFRNIWLNRDILNVESVDAIMKSNFPVWYMKREYSESSNGVCYMDARQLFFSLNAAASKCMPRRSVPLHIGLRFYSHHGRLLACHGGAVLSTHSLQGGVTQAFSYISVRHARAENTLIKMLLKSGFHGFGAAWFVVPAWRPPGDDHAEEFSFSPHLADVFHDTDMFHPAELIDFNPRLERHSCLTFANDTHLDPCRAMWMSLKNKNIQNEEPYFYPANVRMLDPTRFLDYNEMVEISVFEHTFWNLEKKDEALYEFYDKSIREKTK